jgi:putative transposase
MASGARLSRTAVWLYFRFCRSYRDIELMMAERGIVLTYESVRDSCLKFGPYFANELKRRNRKKIGSKWHLDEVTAVRL